jgi:hypothetical protein
MTSRAELHDLVDSLDPEDSRQAERLLAALHGLRGDATSTQARTLRWWLHNPLPTAVTHVDNWLPGIAENLALPTPREIAPLLAMSKHHELTRRAARAHKRLRGSRKRNSEDRAELDTAMALALVMYLRGGHHETVDLSDNEEEPNGAALLEFLRTNQPDEEFAQDVSSMRSNLSGEKSAWEDD